MVKLSCSQHVPSPVVKEMRQVCRVFRVPTTRLQHTAARVGYVLEDEEIGTEPAKSKPQLVPGAALFFTYIFQSNMIFWRRSQSGATLPSHRRPKARRPAVVRWFDVVF